MLQFDLVGRSDVWHHLSQRLGYDTDGPIGVYRTAPEIESFLRSCGMEIFEGSRRKALALSLGTSAKPDGDQLIRRAIERVADPRNYVREPWKTEDVRAFLNASLEADGFEVVILNGQAILRRHGGGVLVEAFAEKSASLDFDTVSREIDRALRNAEHDPEDAVTAACSTLEAVCRSILVELDLPIPDKKDIAGLVRAVQEPLSLSPGRSDLPKEIAEDVRQILSGLTTAARGIGALRTHGGDAHGRERGRRSVDARIARLAIHAASTVALFFIETWERQQKRQLPNREGSA